ncbi:MAG: transcriptional repressor [Rhodospirillaceae bacterium]
MIPPKSDDHPDVEMVYRRASAIEGNISIAMVYRTMPLLEDL